MPELSFKQWVEQKVEEARNNERMQRRKDWLAACDRLIRQIRQWLQEAGEGKITIGSDRVQRMESQVGIYEVEALRIEIGDSQVEVVPIGRGVVGTVNPPGGGEFRAMGRVDIKSSAQKYILYRTIQDGQDVWYAVDEDRYAVTPFTKERLQEILMDLLS